MTLNYAVIPTAGERECLRDCILALAGQVNAAIVVTNGTISQVNRWMPQDTGTPVLYVPYVQPPEDDTYNLSRAWNQGIRAARSIARVHARRSGDADSAADHYVAVLNDDAIVPAGWVRQVTLMMANTGAVAGCSGGPDGQAIRYTKSGPVDVMLRMRGWAYILKGAAGLEADESLAYWFADDDLAWRAADAGGMVMTPGYEVANLYPNGSVTPQLQVRIAKDAARFVEKWGTPAW